MIYEINKKGNYGVITPIPTGGLAATLDKYLQYEAQGKQFMSHPEWAIKRLYKAKKGVFPWGLIRLVERIMYAYCTKNDSTYTNKYKKQVFVTREVDNPKLRDYQNDAIDSLLKNNGGILCMPCGSGKTVTIIEYLKIMSKSFITTVSLVVVPTLDIKKQWEDHKLQNLVVSTYQNPQLKDSQYISQFDIICFDECHRVSAKSIYSIAMKSDTSTILIGISATPDKREDGESMKVMAALGEIIYNIPRKELIEKGWLANAEVFYLTPRFKPMIEYMNYAEVYNLQIVNNEYRNQLIVHTALKEYVDGRKILILVTQVDHGEILLFEFLKQIQEAKFLEKTPEVVFMNGKSKDRNRDMSMYDVIIATSIYDEGYDLPSLDCLILAGSGKSEIKLIQRIGRVLRIKPDGRMARIYDFKSGVKYLKAHYNKRRKLLENEFIVSDVGDLDEWIN